MPAKYSFYSIYPGRQHYITIMPRKHSHLFFDGVQSFDYTPNTDEITHGQYGFLSDVINLRDFRNITGTIGVQDYNNANYVLRALTGQDPDSTFMFDPAYIEHSDLIINKYNKRRDKVLTSQWLVDFLPSTKYASTLDEVETRDMDYSATRILEFDGYQIAYQTFANTTAGQYEFTLHTPALVHADHELCPINYALRVWVSSESGDSSILGSSDQATIVTTTSGTPAVTRSTLVLAEPLASDNQIVKVAWLVDGSTNLSPWGLTQGPVVIRATAGCTTPETPTDPSNEWDGNVWVVLSKPWDSTISDSDITDATAAWDITPPGAGSATAPDSITIDDTVSQNQTALKLTWTTTSNWPFSATESDTAILSYSGTVLHDKDGHYSPSHSIEVPNWAHEFKN